MEKKHGGRILDLLYPRRCPACHDAVRPRGALICTDCRDAFSYITGPVCLRCGRALRDPVREFCRSCEGRRKNFETGVALFNYDDTARESMAWFKYRGRREYARFYAEELLRQHGERLAALAPQLIVPVPVHPERRRVRGYNQAFEIAKILGAGLDIPCREDILIRRRRTEAQRFLGAAGRELNLSEAFLAAVPLPDVSRVLVVDDIYTTGSTMNACAGALRRAGVRHVFSCVVCAGYDR